MCTLRSKRSYKTNTGRTADQAIPRTINAKEGRCQTSSIKDNCTVVSRSICHLMGRDIIFLKENSQLPQLPHVNLEEIGDCSKSDSLIQVIAIVQILWNMFRIIVCRVRHLAISQLEIAVIAFASCAVIMYDLYWAKPKGVQTPITILSNEREANERSPRIIMYY